MSNDSSDKPDSRMEVRQPSRPAWWYAGLGLFATLFIFFASLITAQLIVAIGPILRHWSAAQLEAWFEQSVSAQFLQTFIAYGLMLGGIALMLRLFHWGWRDIGLKAPKWWHFIVGAVAAVPYYVAVFIAIAIAAAFIHGLDVNQQQDVGFHSVHGVLPMMLTLVSLVIIPPIVEEIVMRGFLYTSMKKALPLWAAALAVSALFGLAHLAEGVGGPLWVGAIDTFVLSLTLVALREVTGNLWAGILLHALKNSVGFVYLYLIMGR